MTIRIVDRKIRLDGGALRSFLALESTSFLYLVLKYFDFIEFLIYTIGIYE